MGQVVDIRSFDIRIAISAYRIHPLVIAEQKEDVGFLLSKGNREKQGKDKEKSQGRFVHFIRLAFR
jgi:hypothetical protein